MSQSSEEEFYPILHQLVEKYIVYKLHQSHFQNVLCEEPRLSCPHAASVYLKIVGDEITASNRKINNPFSFAGAERIILQHHDLFSESTFDNKLHITEENLPNVLAEMGQSVFRNKKHWGTYAAFLGFGASIGVYCSRKKELTKCVHQIAHPLTMIMCKELNSWFKENGGSEKLALALMEDLKYISAAQQRKVRYSSRYEIASREFFPENFYLAYKLAEKGIKLLQFVPPDLVSDMQCTRLACTMVSALIRIKNQQEALSMAKHALWILKTSPHFELFPMDDDNTLFSLLKTFGSFFMHLRVKKSRMVKDKVFPSVLVSEVIYDIGVALLRLAENDAKGSTNPQEVLQYKSTLDEAIVLLEEAASLFNSLVQLQPTEDFRVAETDCYYYLEKAYFWKGELDTAQKYSQKILAFKKTYPKEMTHTPVDWHRRASWSKVTGVVEELKAEQLQNTEGSFSEGTKEGEQSKVKPKLREINTEDNQNGTANLLLSLEVPPEILARGQDACHAFQRALEKGKIRNRRIPLMIIGQNRSGKTSLKKSLTGKKFNADEDSTHGIDVDPSFCKITTESWEIGGTETGAKRNSTFSYEYQTAKLVAQELKTSCLATPTFNPPPPSDYFVSTNILQKPEDFPTNIPSDDQHLAVKTTEPLDIVVPDGAKEDTSSVDELSDHLSNVKIDAKNLISIKDIKLPEEISVLIEKLLAEKDQGSPTEEVHLKIWDFAGQSVYYATHPVFLSPKGIFLLTHRLSEDLNGRAKVVVKQGSCKRVEDDASEVTNMDVLHFWMSSVASLHREDLSRSTPDKFPSKFPPVMLVCTWADKPFNDIDPREVARQILCNFGSKKYKDHLLRDFFIVDNTKAGSKEDLEDEEVRRLRKVIHEVAKECLSIKSTLIPIRWFQFEKAIQSLVADGYNLLEISQAKEIARDVCGIEEEREFYTLVNFLHDNRVLIYFDKPEGLGNLIIIDTQWLIDVFKQVITVVPEERQHPAFCNDWKRLETDGVLTKNLALHVWTDLIRETKTMDLFLSVMEKFCLLCRYPSENGEEVFLVPSMLMSRPTHDSNKLPCDVPPLYVQFIEEQVPIGLFPRLLIQFMHWCSKRWSRKRQPRLFCNFARFYIGASGEYSLLVSCRLSVILITVLNEPSKQYSFICREVKCFLEETLSSLCTEFSWLRRKHYQFCVQCTVCSDQICQRHKKESCTEDICKHFISEEELQNSEEPVRCYECVAAMDTTVNTQAFAVWFEFLKSDERDSGIQGRDFDINSCHSLVSDREVPMGILDVLASSKVLALRKGVFDTTLMKDVKLSPPIDYSPEQLVSEEAISLTTEDLEKFISSSSAKDITDNLASRLNIDSTTLEKPDEQACRILRCFSHCVRSSGRTDVLELMKRRLPEGTAGPLVAEHTCLKDIQYSVISNLAIALSGGEGWKELASYLQMSSEKILYLDRARNPALEILEGLAWMNVTVGQLYDILRACSLEVLAEKL